MWIITDKNYARYILDPRGLRDHCVTYVSNSRSVACFRGAPDVFAVLLRVQIWQRIAVAVVRLCSYHYRPPTKLWEGNFSVLSVCRHRRSQVTINYDALDLCMQDHCPQPPALAQPPWKCSNLFNLDLMYRDPPPSWHVQTCSTCIGKPPLLPRHVYTYSTLEDLTVLRILPGPSFPRPRHVHTCSLRNMYGWQAGGGNLTEMLSVVYIMHAVASSRKHLEH